LINLIQMARSNLNHQSAYVEWLKRDLEDCRSILELGCGSNSPLVQNGVSRRTSTMDIWEPYVQMHNRKGDYQVCWQADILTMHLPRKAFDAVVIFDVMEHLPKDKVLDIDLFGKMESCAKKRVIIFAPNGFVENDEVDGDPYQAHVSAWEPEDYLKRGYTVRGGTGLRYILGKASLPKYQPARFWNLVAMASQPFIYYTPKIAWHSYAVKNLK
jgi:hypothetical protein